MNIGELIKNERLKQDISGNKLSKIANISQSGLSAIERGEQDPSFYMIEKICLALNITVQDLITEEKEESKTIDLEKHLHELRIALDNEQVIYKDVNLEQSESILVKNSIDMVLASIKEIQLKNE